MSHLGDLRVVSDVSPAEWVLRRLAPWDLGADHRLRVCSMVPSGFEAYGRLLHPAYTLHDGMWSSVRWSELALRQRTELRADSSFSSISGVGTSDPIASSIREPADGDMDASDLAELISLLGQWTGTADRGWFCVWDGYGWPELPQQFKGPPRVKLEHRACLLCAGRLEDALTLPMGQAPTLWWPQDRSWCVRTDIDGYSTYVAASNACIAALISLASIEVLHADPDDDVPPL